MNKHDGRRAAQRRGGRAKIQGPIKDPADLRRRHLSMAGEAERDGDNVRKEHHYQCAEHYYRTLNCGTANSD